jgi:hypothetical protein
MGILHIDADEKTIERIVDFLQKLPEKSIRYSKEERITKNPDRAFQALKLKTKGVKFDREAAHER